MPDNWHWGLVDAINGRNTVYEVRLVGWNISDISAANPYCVTDEWGRVFWAEHIRFADDDACDPEILD